MTKKCLKSLMEFTTQHSEKKMEGGLVSKILGTKAKLGLAIGIKNDNVI